MKQIHGSSLILTSLALLFCCARCSLTKIRNIQRREEELLFFESAQAPTQDMSKSSQILGYLEVILDYSYTHDRTEDELKVKIKDESSSYEVMQLKACLASVDIQGNWVLNFCLEPKLTSQQTLVGGNDGKLVTLQRFGIARFLIQNQVINTHLLVIKESRDTTQEAVNFWSALPPMSSDGAIISRVSLNTASYIEKNIMLATFSLTCSPNHFGSFCSVLCTPPSDQHRCDQVTGELKCAPGWIGRTCNEQVFISNKKASQFIKERSKRANSWHRAEEFLGGNIERECAEEKCSREEAREAFEDDALTEVFWREYTDQNQCDPKPCVAANSIRCEDLLGDFNCQCRTGFEGKNCQYEIDLCASDPCQNGASCRSHSPTSYACVCRLGFRGLSCEVNIDDCVESNCGLYGSCVDGINNFTCDCDDGFTGSSCEVDIDECESNPCQNGGNCSNHVAFYTCQCPEEYDGTTCENRISPCANGPCQNGGECILKEEDYSFTCSCISEYTGTRCQHEVGSPCASDPCVNGGTCFVDRNILTTNSNHTSSEQVTQHFSCICPIGYRGTTCNETMSPCELEEDDLCPLNATCVGLNRQHLCVCPPGYTGEQCNMTGNDSDVLERLRCQSNPCLNEARCLLHENKTICVCRTGYNGSRCENEVDHCESSPCINDGECIQAPNGFYCNCAQGYAGKYCEEDIDECVRDDSLCHNGGTCTNTEGSFQCVCGPYNTGGFCENPFDPCESAPCVNGGNCTHENEAAQGYMCTCLAGYGGKDCNDIIDPCTDVTNPCQNDAACSVNPHLTSEAICHCPEEFYGRTCEKQTDNCAVPSNITVNLNGQLLPQLVERPDCGQNGTCISTEEGFNCRCNVGIGGSRCDQVFVAPIVNCSTENCLCPKNLLDQLSYHEHNDPLQCHYRHYERGVCDKVTCITLSCPNRDDKHQCKWYSRCLEEFVFGAEESNLTNGTSLCPVIEAVLDQKKLPEGTTTEEFCNEVRSLPSYVRFDANVTIHCSSYNLNKANSTIAIAIDSVTSQDEAYLLALNIFQRLEEELTNDNQSGPNPLADGLDPIFSAILSLRFGGTLGHVQNPFDDKAKPTVPTFGAYKDDRHFATNILYIIIPVIVVLILIILFIAFVWRRRRFRKDLIVTYRANPNEEIPDGDDGSDLAMMTDLNSRQESPFKKSKLNEDFVNPLFVEDQPACFGLTAHRPRVISNDYVASPYLKSHSISSQNSASSPNGSPKKTVEEATIDYGVVRKPKPDQEYETMNGGLTLLFDAKPSTSATDDCGSESDKSSIAGAEPSQRRRSRSRENKEESFSEIDVNKLPLSSENSCETEGLLAPPVSSKKQRKSLVSCSGKQNPTFESEYSFATEVPEIGVPSPFLSRRSTQKQESNEENNENNSRRDSDPPSATTSNNDSGVEVANSSSGQSDSDGEKNVKNEETYQTPTSLFPTHDDLFFPDKDTEISDVYAVPRLANPVDKPV